MLNKLLLCIITFLLSKLLFKRFINKFSKTFLDIPNNRSMHKIATPRGGGIIFIVSTTISSLIYILIYGISKELMIPILILPLGIVGFIDDSYSLPANIKYIIQFITCFFIYLTSNLFLGINLSNLYGLVLIGIIII